MIQEAQKARSPSPLPHLPTASQPPELTAVTGLVADLLDPRCYPGKHRHALKSFCPDPRAIRSK